jgi:hypothetical protein
MSKTMHFYAEVKEMPSVCDDMRKASIQWDRGLGGASYVLASAEFVSA